MKAIMYCPSTCNLTCIQHPFPIISASALAAADQVVRMTRSLLEGGLVRSLSSLNGVSIHAKDANDIVLENIHSAFATSYREEVAELASVDGRAAIVSVQLPFDPMGADAEDFVRRAHSVVRSLPSASDYRIEFLAEIDQVYI